MEAIKSYKCSINLSCPECREQFNTNTKVPKVICQKSHIMCQLCVQKKLYKNSNNLCNECLLDYTKKGVRTHQKYFDVCYLLEKNESMIKQFYEEKIKSSQDNFQKINNRQILLEKKLKEEIIKIRIEKKDLQQKLESKRQNNATLLENNKLKIQINDAQNKMRQLKQSFETQISNIINSITNRKDNIKQNNKEPPNEQKKQKQEKTQRQVKKKKSSDNQQTGKQIIPPKQQKNNSQDELQDIVNCLSHQQDSYSQFEVQQQSSFHPIAHDEQPQQQIHEESVSSSRTVKRNTRDLSKQSIQFSNQVVFRQEKKREHYIEGNLFDGQKNKARLNYESQNSAQPSNSTKSISIIKKQEQSRFNIEDESQLAYMVNHLKNPQKPIQQITKKSKQQQQLQPPIFIQQSPQTIAKISESVKELKEYSHANQIKPLLQKIQQFKHHDLFLTKLKCLDLTNCCLDSMKFLRCLTELKILNLSDNSIRQIQAITYVNIEILNLNKNKIQKLAELHKCLQLQELFLSKNNLKENSIDYFKEISYNLRKLKKISIDFSFPQQKNQNLIQNFIKGTNLRLTVILIRKGCVSEAFRIRMENECKKLKLTVEEPST